MLNHFFLLFLLLLFTSSASVLHAATPVNTAIPVISGSLVAGSTLRVTSGDWSDADNDTLTYRYQWLREGAVIAGATASDYIVKAEDVQKPLMVTVVAADGKGAEVSVNTTAVIPFNSQPRITSTAITQVNEDVIYEYTLLAQDIDSAVLLFSAPTLPSWLRFDTTTGRLSGTPENAQVGNHAIVLWVNDGWVTVEQTFTLTVVNVNDAPMILSSAITAVYVGDPYSLVFNASDVDLNTQLIYSAPTLPGWLSFAADRQTLTGVATASEVGVHEIVLRVSDGIVDEELTFNLTVKPALESLSPSAGIDTDQDGTPDIDEAGDKDNDGIPDAQESNVWDTDGDGIMDFLDTDADDDGLSDRDEGTKDEDLDGVPDRLESNTLDSDNDGRVDALDADSDNDGIEDGIEGARDSDGDGILDRLESNTRDTDRDGLLDYLDTDSDNDGQTDTVEGQGDRDKDGLLDRLESAVIDIDGDGRSNEKDADSDGDGLLDGVEGALDSDQDGLPDSLESNRLDSDQDGTPNDMDTDSDGDGISDGIEGLKDQDQDTLPDVLEANFTDTDNDDLNDVEDTDSDGDTLLDAVEGLVDTDNDGLVDARDTDSDGDGILDSLEGNVDTDGDGQPDYRDTDSDNDGKTDTEEGALDTDNDSYPDRIESSITDADQDGIVDEQDPDSDGNGLTDGTLLHRVVVGGIVTEVINEAGWAKVTSSMNELGESTFKTTVTAVNRERALIAVQVEGYADASAKHRLRINSNGTSAVVSATFIAPGVNTVIGRDFRLTSQQRVNAADVTVTALPDGKAEYQLVVTIDGTSQTTSAQFDVTGAITTVDVAGNIATTLDQSTASYVVAASVAGNAFVQVTPLTDNGNGWVLGETSRTNASLPGTRTRLNEQGDVIITAVGLLSDHRTVEINVRTSSEGEGVAWVTLKDGETQVQRFIANQATPFESGNQIRILKENNQYGVRVRTRVTRAILF